MTKKVLSAAVLSLMMGGLLAHAETLPTDSSQTPTSSKADIVSQPQKTDSSTLSPNTTPDTKPQLNTADQSSDPSKLPQKNSTDQPSEGTTK